MPLTLKLIVMSKLNNFFYYLGLFTVNAFKHNWDAILVPTAIVGTVMLLIVGLPSLFIPAFIGSYLAQIHNEYKQFKKFKDGAE